jgi:hypothetical protein
VACPGCWTAAGCDAARRLGLYFLLALGQGVQGVGVPVMADALERAVHHSIVCVDVEGFGARHRTRADLGAIRHGLYQGLQLAFTRSGVDWDDCYREDRGDGVLILVPPQVPKAVLAAGIPGGLAAAVRAHNEVHDRNAWMRLRLLGRGSRAG